MRIKKNQGLQKLWQLSRNAAGDLLDHTGVATELVLNDLKDLGTNYKDKLDELLEEWAADDTVYVLFEGFLEASEKGWDAAVGYLRARDKQLQRYLEKQVRLTPHLVGGVDGFLQVYLAAPAERWVRSPRYRQGVRIGRIVGVVCAFTIFLPVSIGRAMISLLPGVSRAAKYVAKQWKTAQEKRAATLDRNDRCQ